MSDTKTLGEALPEEMTRVRKLIELYLSIGPAGKPATILMNQSLDNAQRALAEGDVVAMIACYEDLKGYKE